MDWKAFIKDHNERVVVPKIKGAKIKQKFDSKTFSKSKGSTLLAMLNQK